MKPNFALNLTEDGITLLHRTSRGWMDVGNVAFDDPDLGAALDYLRSTALGLSPKGLATKLIIPESQILYLQVDAAGPDDTSRRAQIETALDGRTPYALDELVFDWTGSGPTVTVAVVARETLAEAEGFAAEHRFNPVGFVARPEGGFDKEPFFGPSTLAPSLLTDGDKVEADDAPVTIIAHEMRRAEDAAPGSVDAADEAVAEPEAPAPKVPQSDLAELDLPPPDQPEPEVPEPDLPEHDLPEPEAPQPDLPPSEVPQPHQPEPPAPAPDLPQMQPQADAPAEGPVAEPDPTPSQADPAPISEPEPQPFAATAPVPPAPAQPSTMSAPAVPDEVEAPMAVDVQPEDAPDDVPPMPTSRSASVLSGLSPPLDDLPPPLSAAAMMSFSSRRPTDGAPRPLGGAAAPEAGTATRPVAPSAARPAAAKPIVERPAAARPAPKFSYDDPLPPPARMPGDPPTPPSSVVGKASKGLRNLSSLVTAPSIPGTRKKKPVANSVAAGPAITIKPASALGPGATLSAPMDASPVTASVKAAAQSLSRQAPISPDALAKGLSARTMPQRGKPRYLGLILTGILLLLLALVAAWSSFYLSRSDAPADAVQIATVDDEALADGQDLELEMLADLQEPDDLAVDVDLTEVAAPEEAASTEDFAAADPTADPATVIGEPAPQTGVQDVAAVSVQPDPANQDEIFLAAMDAPPSLRDPLALPPPAAQGDAPPAAQMPPPPFGTVYQFDADGRIVPTAEGILTPEGVMLIAGKPARVPPPRPATLQAQAVETATTEATAPAATPEDVVTVTPSVAEAEVLPADTFSADPTLSAARPRLRPEGLVVDAATDDDASLAPAEDSRFASLRPRLRPAAILAAGEASRRASEAASLAVQAASVEAAVASAADADLSPLAVSVSRVPAPRPRDLSRAVEAAVAAATRRAEPQVVAAAAPAAKAAPVEDHEAEDEPEIAAK
ncbi:hypothetical protein, partial [Pseudotabrizicola sp.]|uniref:hypothetical protein n=1 Tax=Pseudotabrizicola sp. TaxID=2939647 RepID=UPI002719126A